MRPQWLLFASLVGFLTFAGTRPPAAQDAVSEEEARELAVIDRFVAVLEKNPRRGTALDKVYGAHVERGSLDSLIQSYRDRTEKEDQPQAASAGMIVGLLESLRGQDTVAVKAFEDAERLAPDNYLASYYLGQSLLLVGQSDKAAEALERAIARKPAQADLLDVFQALGRVYQRAQKTDKALEIWNRLEQQFPNDVRVQEQIATTLLEEGEFATALPRFENLIKVTKDKYRQSLFQVEVAEIKVRLGQTDDAIKEFERLLSQLNPESWLFREVRRRIEAIFLRTEDQAGLTAYYETWLKKNPEDLEAVSRLARLYTNLSRGAEAQAWLERGLKSAPSRKELRLALIHHLLYEQKYTEAIPQYEQLDKYEPNNPDTLREWGRLILKDTARDYVTRKQDAAVVWHKLVASKPDDPFVASQVGELFRHAEMTDEALKLYRRAVELAPEAAQYREYLGEYYHSLKRTDEALATWRQIAEGKLKTAPNLARLAEVLSGFGHLTEAVEANAAACLLDPKDFNLQLKHVDLLSRADRHDEALKQLVAVQKLAANDEEREACLRREIQELQAVEGLQARIAEARKEIEIGGEGESGRAGDKAKQELADRWYWLARAHEAERQMKEAARAVAKASELAPQSIPVLTASARIHEAQNNLLPAIEINTKLAAIDRRYRTEYLQRIATLEQKLGRRDKALQAGRDLLAAAPGNPELYEFFSQLCFQLGAHDEGLQALRRSLRVNPHDQKTLLRLATALVERNQSADAIELYWRAFERSQSLEERLGIVQQLAQPHWQTKQIERLFERLERARREPSQQREMTLCLAQACQTTGDDGKALKELETLLTEGTRDTMLLAQLRKLAEKRNEWEAAIRYQRQLWQITQDKGDRFQLAQLLMKFGQVDESIELLASATQSKELTPDVLKLIDSLQDLNQTDAVLARLKPLRGRFPDNWELLYREGAALADKHPVEAIQRFEALLALNCSQDEPSLVVTNMSTAVARGYSTARLPLVERTTAVSYFRSATAQPTTRTISGRAVPMTRRTRWMPHDYGAARVAAWGSLINLARTQQNLESFLATTLKRLEESPSQQALEDRYFLHTLVGDSRQKHRVSRELAQRPDAGWDAKIVYLQSLVSRRTTTTTTANGTRSEIQQGPPLEASELNEALAMYREIAAQSDLSPYNVTLMSSIAAELTIAGKTDAAERLFADAVDKAASPIEVVMLLSQASAKNDADVMVKLLDRMIELERQPVLHVGSSQAQAYVNAVRSSDYRAQLLMQFVSRRPGTPKLDELLEIWRRCVRLDAFDLARKLKQPAARNTTANRVTMQRADVVAVEPILPSIVYGLAPSSLLLRFYTQFKADEPHNIIEAFRRESQMPDLNGEERLLWLHGLAHLYWHDGKKDQALETFDEALTLIPDRLDLRLHLAGLYEKAGKQSRGLDLVEHVVPDSIEAMLDCERLALRLALHTGRLERAKVAAERLFGAKLPPHEVLPLAEQMIRLDMTDHAEALLSRAAGPLQGDVRAQSVLMDIQLSRGRKDEATQTALNLLKSLDRGARTIANPALPPATASGQRVTYRPAVYTANPMPPAEVSGYRQRVYRVLNQTGKLAEMIDQAEAQLKQTPASEPLIITLIAYYTAAENLRRTDELTLMRHEIEINKPQNRYAAAIKCLELGRSDEAITHIKVLIEKDPPYFASRCTDLVFRFDERKQLDGLIELFQQVDWSLYDKHPQVFPKVVELLMSRPASRDQAVKLFLNQWQLRPNNHVDMLHRFSNEDLWKMSEVAGALRKLPIPADAADVTHQWSIFGRVLKQEADGSSLVTVLSRLLNAMEERGELDTFAGDIEQGLAQWSDWTAGRLLLALVDLRRNRIDAGRDALDKLLPPLSKQFANSPAQAWEIAQELIRHDASVDVGIRYYELALRERGTEVWTSSSSLSSSSSPGRAIIKSLIERGQRNEARRLLLQLLPPSILRTADATKPPSQVDLHVAQWIGRELRNAGHVIDSIHVYQAALSRSEGTPIGGYDPRVDLQSSLVIAFKEAKPESLAEYLGLEASSRQSLDLQLFVSEPTTPAARIRSRWQPLLKELADQPELAARTKALLTAEAARLPHDPTPLVLLAELTLAMKADDEFSSIATKLTQFVDEHPWDSTVSKQPQDRALSQTALWLVARHCLPRASPASHGAKLGERALFAAQHAEGGPFPFTILGEWIELAEQAGDTATAERLRMQQKTLPTPVETPPKRTRRTNVGFD